MYFWLCWVSVAAQASLWSWGAGFPSRGPRLLGSIGAVVDAGLKNPVGRGARWAAVRAEAESRTRLRHQHLQGLNCFGLCLLHSQVDSLPLSRQGSLCTLLIARFLFCFVLFPGKARLGNNLTMKMEWFGTIPGKPVKCVALPKKKFFFF